MRASHRRSSALDRREQGRSRGVRRTSTSIHHDQRQGFRVEAKFPFLYGHSEWDAQWHGRFRAAHGDIGHIRHISTSAHQHIRTHAFESAGRGGETSQSWDHRGLAARPVEWTALYSARAGRRAPLVWRHLVHIGGGESPSVARATGARPCPGHRMAAPGRGRLF